MTPHLSSSEWARAFDWAQRCATENPGIRYTAEMGPYRLSYTVVPTPLQPQGAGWPVIRVYQIKEY